MEGAPAGETQHREQRLVTRRVARGGRAVGVRSLRDRRGELRVVRRDPEDVAARQGEAPDREPGRVDSGQAGSERGRRLPVGELFPDADNLAWLPSALPVARVKRPVPMMDATTTCCTLARRP